jgi:hypothetical protein
MQTSTLFADFDPELVAGIERAQALEDAEMGRARAARTRNRHLMRRAKSEKALAEVLPAVIEPGDSWDVISQGDVDSLSFLARVIEPTWFDYVAISTWCIARTDLDQLGRWLDAGKIDKLELFMGEIFPGTYIGEYERARELVRDYGARLVITRNHSKVMLAGNSSTGTFLSIRSSANVNTNPRIEQTTITHDRALFDFYKEFFDGLTSFERTRKS